MPVCWLTVSEYCTAELITDVALYVPLA